MGISLITLTTDFGVGDEYVGVMKGVILSINPSAKIVDITHHIMPQDLHEAAYTISASYKYFPEGSIHVIVVDPGVGSRRKIIALSIDNQIFLAPNNGILSHVMKTKPVEKAVCVENKTYFRRTISRTFHGRDIFAPVAAHLTTGVPITQLGAAMDQNKIIRLEFNDPDWSEEEELVGSVVWVDRFGNLGTNIHRDHINKHFPPGLHKNLMVVLAEKEIKGLSTSYMDVGLKNPLAIIGSRGYLELAVCCGHAGQFFQAQKGDKVKIFVGSP